VEKRRKHDAAVILALLRETSRPKRTSSTSKPKNSVHMARTFSMGAAAAAAASSSTISTSCLSASPSLLSNGSSSSSSLSSSPSFIDVTPLQHFVNVHIALGWL
jgi:hypothetical protein